MAKKQITIIREHPALFLGEERDDLERVWAEDENKNHVPFYFKNNQDEPEWQIVSEVLVAYPNDAEFGIIEN